MNKKILSGLLLLLIACGDDSSSATSQNSGDEQTQSSVSNSEVLSSESNSDVQPSSSDDKSQSSSSGDQLQPSSSNDEKDVPKDDENVEKCQSTEVAGFKTWCGDGETFVVSTGLDYGKEESGYWWSFSDENEGGGSFLDWPYLGNFEYDEWGETLAEVCGGICGTYKLDKGIMDDDPFVGVGFNVADSYDDNRTGDASEWGGICVSYSADLPVAVMLGLDSDEKLVNGDNPLVLLEPSAEGNVVRIAWDEFKQSGNGGKEISGEDAAKVLHSIKFRIQGSDGATGKFNIMSVGAYEGGCALTHQNKSKW